MRPFIASLLLTVSLIFTVGCSDTATEDTPVLLQKVDPTGTVSGTITDPAGAPLAGVDVVSGTETTTTNTNGVYTLTLTADKNASITADLLNHTQNSRVVNVKKDKTTTLDLTLANVDVIEIFDATDGVTITTKGATIELPKAYTYPDGTAYTGEVTAKVSYNRVTTVQGAKAFPGDYIGLQTDGSDTVLQSYGFIDVVLEDENGNELQLADNATARLTYPMDNHIGQTPASIPLWYYDTNLGIWVEDGLATYDATTNTYSGDVSHFTTWNLDRKFDGAEFNGCIEDINGIPVPTADLYISGAGWRKHRVNQDPQGKFRLINAPSGLPISIFAQLDPSISVTQTVTLTPGEVRIASECLVINQDLSALYATITGRLIGSDGLAIDNVKVNIDIQGASVVYTDVNGTFTTSTFQRPANNKANITFTLSQDITITKTFVLDTFNLETDIGTIELRSTHVLGCVVDNNDVPYEYTGEGGGNIFIDSPYPAYSRNFDEITTGNGGLFDFYIPIDYKEHTIYAFDSFQEALSTSYRFTTGLSTLDLRDNCLKLSPIVERAITTTIEIIDHADTNATLIIEHGTNDINNQWGFPYFYGETIARDVNTTSYTDLKDGIYLVQLQLPNNDNLDFSGVQVHVVIEGQIDQVITVPVSGESDLWGGDWFFFKIEVFQGEATITEVNVLGNVPV